jgi:hypothetical protein
VVVVGTHDVEGLLPRIMKSRWRHFDVPQHVYFFSRGTLTKMLTEAGFETFKVSETPALAATIAPSRDASGLYGPIRLLHRSRLINVAAPLLRATHAVARALNLSDGVTTYSRKL